jgi:hypothetical protein
MAGAGGVKLGIDVAQERLVGFNLRGEVAQLSAWALANSHDPVT